MKDILDKFIQEVKHLSKDLEKEKARCAKEYPDWEDNEFNMLDHKFIWGYNVNPNITPSFLSWDDAFVYFNRKDNKYYMTIDTGLFTRGYQDEPAWVEIERLSRIDEAFRNFLIENDLRMNADFEFFQDLFLCADNLTELYTKFRIQLEGYKWYKLNRKGERK